VLKVHLAVYIFDFGEPTVEVKVPDDYGELPEATSKERPASCTTSSGRFVDGVWVGDDYFELRQGCCDEHNGGLFQCKATR
jgi:hypothetical protein